MIGAKYIVLIASKLIGHTLSNSVKLIYMYFHFNLFPYKPGPMFTKLSQIEQAISNLTQILDCPKNI